MPIWRNSWTESWSLNLSIQSKDYAMSHKFTFFWPAKKEEKNTFNIELWLMLNGGNSDIVVIVVTDLNIFLFFFLFFISTRLNSILFTWKISFLSFLISPVACVLMLAKKKKKILKIVHNWNEMITLKKL